MCQSLAARAVFTGARPDAHTVHARAPREWHVRISSRAYFHARFMPDIACSASSYAQERSDLAISNGMTTDFNFILLAMRHPECVISLGTFVRTRRLPDCPHSEICAFGYRAAGELRQL